ncbi:hypothetical protein ACWDKQ_21200 [Saccharopolyspora sp. NPDC000995]
MIKPPIEWATGTYTKEHSAEHQSQALIDLARRLGPRIGDLTEVSRACSTSLGKARLR